MFKDLAEFEKNTIFVRGSGMRICYGKNNGGHQLIAHGEGFCPLCKKIIDNRGVKQKLEAVMFMKNELILGNISIEEYARETKRYGEKDV